MNSMSSLASVGLVAISVIGVGAVIIGHLENKGSISPILGYLVFGSVSFGLLYYLFSKTTTLFYF